MSGDLNPGPYFKCQGHTRHMKVSVHKINNNSWVLFFLFRSTIPFLFQLCFPFPISPLLSFPRGPLFSFPIIPILSFYFIPLLSFSISPLLLSLSVLSFIPSSPFLMEKKTRGLMGKEISDRCWSYIGSLTTVCRSDACY